MFIIVLQLSWLVSDEVCSMSLEEMPLKQETVSCIVEHIRHSKRSPTALISAVPVQFLVEGSHVRDVFNEVNILNILI